jgi:phosphate transport system permease protein
MKSKSRGAASGQTLLAQGEPMVWLTGGMFAIACAMILSLLAFILAQGLATHWQRPFAIYPLNAGGFVAGELQNIQPYTISRQSLGELDPISRAKAESLLADREQALSSQRYLRTGNYDVGNRHFAFLPEIAIDSKLPFFPKDLWLMERREWGILYGFPTQLRATFAPAQDADYQQLSVLATQFEQVIDPSAIADAKSFQQSLNSVLLTKAEALARTFQSNDISTREARNIEQATQTAMSRSRTVHHQMETAKIQLGRSDRELSSVRTTIRQAELRDGTDLQTIGDEAIELASTQANIMAQADDALASATAWERELLNDKSSLATLGKIKQAISDQSQETIKSMDETLAVYKANRDRLPATSRNALNVAFETALRATQSQYAVNQKIIRLEQLSKSQTIQMQLPIAEAMGDFELPTSLLEGKSDEIPANLAAAFESQEKQIDAPKLSTATPIKLSESHTLLVLQGGTECPFYLVVVRRSGLDAVGASAESEIQKDLAKPSEVYKMVSKDVLVSDIVRFTSPNQLSWLGKLNLYIERWIEFLFGSPREAGIEGGFFPALWGTVVMTLIMSIAVMPFGVMAALYMREYAKSGWLLSLIRISINNLAGVPSIVYGVFGLAFFCYTIGGYIDGGPTKAGFAAWPSGTWFVAFAGTAVCGTTAFFLAFVGSGSPAQQSKLRKRVASMSGLFWFASLIGLVALFAKSPFFSGFYEASLPNPTFGKGCLLWASCTLALLTLPVVIVATEEALSSVPNSLREGSYACGAGKWQTLQRIVLPYARPGIITGFILAMARGAGEVAPMMLVGAIPLATDLPLDLEFPFFHGSRSFMHLGFQIYSLGFQSQNSEAAKPMVFTATLLLLTLVTLLNVTAIWLRARLRKRFQGSQF